jgi:cobalt-zinc-cadmium efflux system protein
MNALTAHILVKQNLSMQKVDEIKHEIKHELLHLNIHHSTLEFEQGMKDCEHEKV